MTDIDLTDSQQVFDRMAQLTLDTEIRQKEISEKLEAQNAADEEYDRLERVARAYLATNENIIVTATAYQGKSRYSWEGISYALVNILGVTECRPMARVVD